MFHAVISRIYALCDTILCMMMHSKHNEDSVLNQNEESSGCYSDRHASFMHEALGNMQSRMANWLAYGPSSDVF